MNVRKKHVLVGLATVAVCFGAIVLMPANRKLRPSEAVDPPDEISVMGIVRDFPESHPDFQPSASGDPGQHTGLVGEVTGPQGRPVFTGPGYRVIAPATDGSGRNIAPHLAGWGCDPGEPTGVPPLVAQEMVFGQNTGRIDGYDAWRGVYGGPNAGRPTTVATNSTAPGMVTLENGSQIVGNVLIGPGGDPATVVDVKDETSSVTGAVSVMTESVPLPTITVPPLTGVAEQISLADEATLTVSADALLSDLLIGQGATLTIDGNVTLVVLGSVTMHQSSRIEIPAGSTLDLYCHGRFQVNQLAFANPDTSAAARLRVSMLGAEAAGDIVELRNQASFCGRIVAPATQLNLEQHTNFYGTFIGKTIRVANSSQFHADNSGYTGGPGTYPDDTPATLSLTPGDGGISDAASFDQWFRDLPGVNMSAARSIVLQRQYDGTYLYDDTLDPRYSALGGFWPIDGALLGNEDQPHNHHFTCHYPVSFVYDMAAAQYLMIRADGDVWVFIDGVLAIDLGGLRSSTVDQRIDLERLCLVDGETYTLSIFLAERERAGSHLRIETNIPFAGSRLPTFTEMYD